MVSDAYQVLVRYLDATGMASLAEGMIALTEGGGRGARHW